MLAPKYASWSAVSKVTASAAFACQNQTMIGPPSSSAVSAMTIQRKSATCTPKRLSNTLAMAQQPATIAPTQMKYSEHQIIAAQIVPAARSHFHTRGVGRNAGTKHQASHGISPVASKRLRCPLMRDQRPIQKVYNSAAR